MLNNRLSADFKSDDGLYFDNPGGTGRHWSSLTSSSLRRARTRSGTSELGLSARSKPGFERRDADEEILVG
jgi:hypothetical protein